MKSQSKKGVALVYAIITAILLMLLVAALVAAATFNLRQSRTSLTSRQAYLDAKSAMNYSRAYLKLYAGQEQKMALISYKLTAINQPTDFARYKVSANLGGNVGSAASDQLQNFTVQCKEDAGQQVVFNSTATGGTFKAQAPYHYNGITASTDAAAAGRWSVLTFKLGNSYYTPVKKPTYSAGSINDFLITANGYSSNTFFGNAYEGGSPCFTTDEVSAYTLVCLNTLQQPDGLNNYTNTKIMSNVPTLTAPEIYLMNHKAEQFSGDSARFYGQSYANLKSNFICICGNLYGQDSRTGYKDYDEAIKQTDSNAYSRMFLSTADNSSEGIVRFANACTVTVSRSTQSDNKSLADRVLVIPAGYYKFKSGTNLLNLVQNGSDQEKFYDLSNPKSQLLTRIKDTDVDAKTVARSDQIISNYGNGTAKDGGFNFTFAQGSDSSGNSQNFSTEWCVGPSDNPATGLPNSRDNFSRTSADEIVYWHVNSTDNWQNAFSNIKSDLSGYGFDTPKEFGINTNRGNWREWDVKPYSNNFGLYNAKQIYLNYVNAKADSFTIPADSTVAFQTSCMWFNSAKEDGKLGHGGAVTGADKGSHLYLISQNFSDNVTLTVPAELKVTYHKVSDAGVETLETYYIETGTYSVPNKTDLLSAAGEKLLNGSTEGIQVPDSSAADAASTGNPDSTPSATIDPDGGGYYVEN